MLKIVFAQSISQNILRPKEKLEVIIFFFPQETIFLLFLTTPATCYLKSSNQEPTIFAMISSNKRFGLLCTVCFPCCSSRSSEKCSENFSLSKKVSMDFLFSSLAKAQIPKKILPFSQLKVSLCCLHSVNLNRQGLEYETVCVGENPYLLNVVSSNVTGASEGNRL